MSTLGHRTLPTKLPRHQSMTLKHPDGSLGVQLMVLEVIDYNPSCIITLVYTVNLYINN